MPPKRKQSGAKRARSESADDDSSSEDVLANLVGKIEGGILDDGFGSESEDSDAAFSNSSSNSDEDDEEEELVSSDPDDGDAEQEQDTSTSKKNQKGTSSPGSNANKQKSEVEIQQRKPHHDQQQQQEVFTMRSVTAAGTIQPTVGMLSAENAAIIVGLAHGKEKLHISGGGRADNNDQHCTQHSFSSPLLSPPSLSGFRNTTAAIQPRVLYSRIQGGNTAFDTKGTVANSISQATADGGGGSSSSSVMEEMSAAAMVEAGIAGGYGVSTSAPIGTSANIAASFQSLGGYTGYNASDRETAISSLVVGAGVAVQGNCIPGTSISSNQMGSLNQSMKQRQQRYLEEELQAARGGLTMAGGSSSSTSMVVSAVGPALPFTASGPRLESTAVRTHLQQQGHILEILEGKQSIRNVKIANNVSAAEVAASQASSSVSLDHSRMQSASYIRPSGGCNSINDDDNLGDNTVVISNANQDVSNQQQFLMSLLSNKSKFDVFTATLESTLESIRMPSVVVGCDTLLPPNGGGGDTSNGIVAVDSSDTTSSTILNDVLIQTVKKLVEVQHRLKKKVGVQQGSTTTTSASSARQHPLHPIMSPFAQALQDTIVASEGASVVDELNNGKLSDLSLFGGAGGNDHSSTTLMNNLNGTSQGASVTTYASVRRHQQGDAAAAHEHELFSFFDDSDGEDNNNKSELVATTSSPLIGKRRAVGGPGGGGVGVASSPTISGYEAPPKQHQMRSFLDRAEFLRAADEAEYRHALNIEQRNKDAEMRTLRRRNNGGDQ